MDFKQWVENEDAAYRGLHTAPNKHSGAPLHDLTILYPEDIYSDNAVRYYGTRSPHDYFSISVIQSARNRPQMRLIIYRAVPTVITTQERVQDLEKQKRYILKTGKIPPGISTSADRSTYYDKISVELEKLQSFPQTPQPKVTINKGDWVTINRDYAVEHGKDQLGRYRILSKTVRAKDVYTAGDSVHEWGYDPQ